MTDRGESSEITCSVCIANYRGIDMIDDCIDSVRQQINGCTVEIIVHDDASDDGSAAYIRARHPDVRLIESMENVGYCIANNRMAGIARGRYLLLLNNDAVLLPDALAVLVAEAARLGTPAILTLPQYDMQTGRLLDIGSRLDPFLNAVPNGAPQRGAVGMVAGACLWIDKTLWRVAGGFPDWFGSLAEDLFLCCFARLAGYPVQALAQSGYRHHVGAQFGGGRLREGRLSTTFQRRALTERNKTFVMVMLYPSPVVQLVLPLHLLLLLIEGALLSVLNFRVAYLRQVYFPVFGALFRFRKQLSRSRAAASAMRCQTTTEFFSAFDPFPYKLRMLLRHGLPETK